MAATLDRINRVIAEATGLPLVAVRFADDYYLCHGFEGEPRNTREQQAQEQLSEAYDHCFYLSTLNDVPPVEWGTRAVELLNRTTQ